MSRTSIGIALTVLFLVGTVNAQTSLFTHDFPNTPRGSWNPTKCSPVLRTISDIMSIGGTRDWLNGSIYQTSINRVTNEVPNPNGVDNGTGGIGMRGTSDMDKRSLSPPCMVRNIYGTMVPTFVEIDNVSFPATFGDYRTESNECFRNISGLRFCDTTGNIDPFGVSHPCSYCRNSLHVEFDQNWMNASQIGYGPPAPTCPTTGIFTDNGTLAPCAIPHCASPPCPIVAIDVQGFVFWDPRPICPDLNGTTCSTFYSPLGGHWELHPFTAWKIHG